MEIKIIQGINLDSMMTSISFKSSYIVDEKIIELLNKIINYHRLFGDRIEYYSKYDKLLHTFRKGENISISSLKEKVTHNGEEKASIDIHKFIVYSHLPNLWSEIFKVVYEYLDAKISFEETNDKIHSDIIKKQIESMSTIPILTETIDQGYEINQFFVNQRSGEGISSINKYYLLGIACESSINCAASSSFDSHIAQKIQRDKIPSNTFFDNLGLPNAPWHLLGEEIDDCKLEVDRIFDNYKKPFVIKPNGLTGGAGVTTNIISKEQAYKAIQMAYEAIHKKIRAVWQTKIIIQEQVSGEDYRILIINGKYVAATKRIPAYVIGDGTSNIEQLIDEINRDPNRDKLNPTHTLKPIEKNEMLEIFLKEQDLSYVDIPTKGQRIYVRKTASMSQGGMTKDVTDIVHPQIKDICVSIAKSMHAYCVGIDILCKDISAPLTLENGTILEVNMMPEMYLNIFPSEGKNRPEAIKEFVDGLIVQNNKCKKIVIISADPLKELEKYLTDTKLTELIHNEKLNIGTYHNETIYNNGHLINGNLQYRNAILALKRNRNLDIICHCFDNPEQVALHGTGFDRIDTLITSFDLTRYNGIAQAIDQRLIKEIIKL